MYDRRSATVVEQSAFGVVVLLRDDKVQPHQYHGSPAPPLRTQMCLPCFCCGAIKQGFGFIKSPVA